MKTIFSLAICAMAVLITSCGNSGESNSIKSFSIAEDKQVVFSPGNLQYNAMYNQWRFAESQTDYIGEANSNISSTHDGWIDLFGWSTSSTNFGVSRSTHDKDYSGSFVDWGRNQIGDDSPNTWRTLTWYEWKYLLEGRTNASSLMGYAYVNSVRGLVLLPDNWTCPRGVTFNSSSSNSVEDCLTFTADQWSKLETAGAIFLPDGGYRVGQRVYDGFGYWTATAINSLAAECFSDIGIMRHYGNSIRLVKDLHNVVVEDSVSEVTLNTNDRTEKKNVSDTQTLDATYDYVDLGLSVVWATMNVGANCPEDFGDYFAWGETTPQRSKTYNYRTYKWSQEDEYSYYGYILTKYCRQYVYNYNENMELELRDYNEYGKIDNKETLELSDDAARANWGGKWRMPTLKEMQELCTQCSWGWVCKNGIYGYEVKSNKNHNSIFLPAAGYYYYDLNSSRNASGLYWSSDLASSQIGAYVLHFYASEAGHISKEDRARGASVRPVKKL